VSTSFRRNFGDSPYDFKHSWFETFLPKLCYELLVLGDLMTNSCVCMVVMVCIKGVWG